MLTYSKEVKYSCEKLDEKVTRKSYMKQCEVACSNVLKSFVRKKKNCKKKVLNWWKIVLGENFASESQVFIW